MFSINRRTFLRRAGVASALLSGVFPGRADEITDRHWQGGELGNGSFRLSLHPAEGLKNTRLTHVPSSLLLADGDYSYSFGRPSFSESSNFQSPDGSSLILLRGSALRGYLEVLHQFRVPPNLPWIEEQITLTNRGPAPLSLEYERCGFVLPVPLSQRKVVGNWAHFKLTAVPYRREPNGHRRQYADFTLTQLLNEEFSSELWAFETAVVPRYASEGWAWTDGKQGFLITKYSQRGMEWSLLDSLPLEDGRSGLRWGGYGIHHGDPEHGAWIAPGESHRFGVTRLTSYRGGVLEGFYSFRAEMEARGHVCPRGFDPPVHWNELYDNKLWWLPGEEQDNPEMRKKYYTLPDMKEEASKARSIGCQALYMDPGWDTSFASKIWDQARLGSYKSFTEMLNREYDLKSSLHTPLSGWCDPSSYPPEMNRLDRFGQRLMWDKRRGFLSSPLCGASRPYIEETARRLKVLARDGAAYFMFDGTMFHGECWDAQHGHPVPARREEHVQAICRLARIIHDEFPGTLIEMHDPVVGGQTIRYAPTYYGHGRAPEGEEFSQAMGFDSVWAFELMWMPMEDVLSGRAIALYYYNLAYSLPLYIHIDLRTDNRNALVFWWYASTCRHLGIGGTPADLETQAAHRKAMASYRRLDRFYKAGTFYGVEETVHVHVDPEARAAVINCFNLEEEDFEKEVEFNPETFGLDPKRSYQITGASSQAGDKGYILRFKVPARGHRLAEIHAI